jgi:MFS family permease
LTHDPQLAAAEIRREASDQVEALPPSELNRAKWAGFVGTMLENFDMVIYSMATAVVFNRIFFPNVTPATGYVASFGAYAVCFAARPLGGLFFSRFGDRIGRKFVMVATLYLMGTATFAMGLLPTYAQVGLLAPLLLVLCRFVQGFGAGAEMASGVVSPTECAPRGKRGATTSLVWVGGCVGRLRCGSIGVGGNPGAAIRRCTAGLWMANRLPLVHRGDHCGICDPPQDEGIPGLRRS